MYREYVDNTCGRSSVENVVDVDAEKIDLLHAGATSVGELLME